MLVVRPLGFYRELRAKKTKRISNNMCNSPLTDCMIENVR
jgi:hypothetical protein